MQQSHGLFAIAKLLVDLGPILHEMPWKVHLTLPTCLLISNSCVLLFFDELEVVLLATCKRWPSAPSAAEFYYYTIAIEFKRSLKQINKPVTYLFRVILGKRAAIFKLAQNVLERFAGVWNRTDGQTGVSCRKRVTRVARGHKVVTLYARNKSIRCSFVALSLSRDTCLSSGYIGPTFSPRHEARSDIIYSSCQSSSGLPG